MDLLNEMTALSSIAQLPKTARWATDSLVAFICLMIRGILPAFFREWVWGVARGNCPQNKSLLKGAGEGFCTSWGGKPVCVQTNARVVKALAEESIGHN
jgi:hypothetical protein